MNRLPSDQADRDRFTRDWTTNLAVVANAGSGKTTAISRRLAAMALTEAGGELLARTAVVAYTNKAADQIGRRAREEVLARIEESGGRDLAPLARLDRAFFGTIHRFCVVLARTHGSELGVHMNPTVIDEDNDDSPWDQFVEQDPMQFGSLAPAQIDAFLRHASLTDVFSLARRLSRSEATWLGRTPVPASIPAPDPAALEALLGAASKRRGDAAAKLEANKETARAWVRRFAGETGRLPIAKPEGKAAGVEDHYRRLFAPVREWLAQAGGALAAELSLRYLAWRQDHGLQTYADQVETARAILSDPAMLERIRGEGRRVILDEAQDTDPVQFSVLVEIARPPNSRIGTWPGRGGGGPAPGHFCMVGDAQQSIYASRADIGNFMAHVGAFERGDGGERLTFGVTFRAPRRVVRLLNETMPAAFGRGCDYNFDVPPADGGTARFLQVPYEPLEPGPSNAEGGAWRIQIVPAAVAGTKHVADRILENEVRQVAQLLSRGGPASVGAGVWGDICILAPRNAWLSIVRDEFEAAGLKTALQVRRSRNGDNPVYAWMCGLLAVACDPENLFEWVGVLREVFAVSDSLLAGTLRDAREIRWEEPESYPGPIRGALEVLGPFISRADSDGEALGRFASDLAAACGLAEKARLADPDGGLGDELSRLLAQSDELGLAGASPREWLRALLSSIEGQQAPSRPAPDAINMITSHSAKGLEWPVVIPVGLWREIGTRKESGLRIISGQGGGRRVVLDSAGVGADARLAKERELQRDHVRLLYVTLTRSKAALVIPWADSQAAEDNSFASFWKLDPARLDPLPAFASPAPVAGGGAAPDGAEGSPPAEPPREATGTLAPPFPRRLLPHELARAPDLARSALHESSLDEAAPVRDGADPMDYGVWWHRMLEFVPWRSDDAGVAAHGAESLAGAESGFQARGLEEWQRLLASEPWSVMRDPRWTALAEVGIFAPLGEEGWIDGVMDLVLHDPAAEEVWIVDWKTNRGLAGEDAPALLARLAAEYEGQLRAYGRSAAGFFPGCSLRLWVYSTVAGAWAEIRGT
jgi:ATP-dependent helicase/nuclease subunit A